jgi:uncharacterized protein YndB with AHSA1/START domain
MAEDSVVREIVIDAPVERVWELTTRAEHIQAWYDFDGAKIDLRPGEVIEHFWRARPLPRGVDEVLAPERLSYWYSNVPDAAPEAGRRPRVVFALAKVPGGTLVRVTESGFRQLTPSDDERQAYAG